MNKDGLMWRRFSEKIVPWSDVEKIDEMQVKSSKFVVVYLKEGIFEKYCQNWQMKLPKFFRGKKISISTGLLDVKHDEALNAARGWLNQAYRLPANNPDDIFKNLEF